MNAFSSDSGLTPPTRRFPPDIDISRCLLEPPEPMDFVLPAFLAGTVGGLVSPGGAGKSFWAMEASISVAAAVAGADMLGLGAKKAGKVIFFSGEDPEIAIHHRIYAHSAHLSPKERDAILPNLES